MTRTAVLHQMLADVVSQEEPVDLLMVAAAVFAELGFRKTSMNDIARRAGLSRVTLYRKYGSKNKLVVAVVVAEARRSLTRIMEQISRYTSDRDQFVRGFVATVLTARNHPLVQRFVEGDRETMQPREFAATTSQIVDLGCLYMTPIINQLQERGVYRGVHPELLAELLIRFWQSLIFTPSSHINPDDERDLTRLTNDFLYPLIVGVGAPGQSPTRRETSTPANPKKED